MNTTQNTHLPTSRDYDQEPIVILDSSHKLSLWLFFLFALSLYSYMLLKPTSHFTYSNLVISTAIFVFPVLFKSLSLLRQEQKIILKNNTVIRQWGNNIIEINWSKNTTTQKSFIDFFDQRQTETSWQKYLGALLNVIYLHPLLLIGKFLYNFYQNRLSSYRLFDTLIIQDNEKMIAIVIDNNMLYQELEEYLYSKQIMMDNLAIFYTPFYLSLEFISKD